MISPKVSVILPAFNADAYLASAIDSILNQSFPDFELIIINDGSTDKTESIIQSYNDERIILLNNPINRGLVYSLNYGIENAKGEYIARMDADDISLIDRLKIQLEFLDANPAYGMCGTFYQVIDIKGKLMHKVDLPESDKDLRTFLNFGNCFCHSTVMFRKVLSNTNKYEELYFLIEDYKLWYEFSKICSISILPEYLLHYRVHSNNISATKKVQMHQMLMGMYNRILHDLQIPFSDYELVIHTNFLVFNFQFFNSSEDFKRLESWLLKVYSHVKDEPGLNKQIITKIFLRRWFVICIKTKNFKKLFFSPMVSCFKLRYIRHFSEKLADSFFKRNLGIDF